MHMLCRVYAVFNSLALCFGEVPDVKKYLVSNQINAGSQLRCLVGKPHNNPVFHLLMWTTHPEAQPKRRWAWSLLLHLPGRHLPSHCGLSTAIQFDYQSLGVSAMALVFPIRRPSRRPVWSQRWTGARPSMPTQAGQHFSITSNSWTPSLHWVAWEYQVILLPWMPF